MTMCVTAAAIAQTPHRGYVSLGADHFPNREATTEMRARVFAEEEIDPTPKLLVTVSGFAEGLLRSGRKNTRDAIFRVQEGTLEFRTDRFEILAGYGTVVWGVLDELQPTDVVNPLDVSRFFFDGRGEARLPVGLARVRLFLSENASIEGLYVPFFRRGRFDQLDEPASPFNIVTAANPAQHIQEDEPARSLRNAQGGGRLRVTTGRVDWSISAFRGFDAFALFSSPLQPRSAPFSTSEHSSAPFSTSIVGTFPRFTMVGGDFETARGNWGVRGEVAAFAREGFHDPVLRTSIRDSMDAGLGVDRKAGEYRVSGTILLHHEASVTGSTGRTDVSLALGSDRTFARERYQLRTFAVYSPTQETAFLRAIATAKLRDNVAVEGSGGWLAGDGTDLIGRFRDSDFVYARVKYYF
ncbi:MAG: hypothetical protein A3H96_00665 [Acidobacteria bacterium RIFCSPLOWO2_02_FULL_67_36]|nr:MAG: hypothetical protein A3H96_00665 [Acidobacteria bacterium RIFCSPLOWO2_02_FULL_67_36]